MIVPSSPMSDPSAQPGYGARMELRDAPLGEPEQLRDVRETYAILIMLANDDSLSFGQPVDRERDQRLELAPGEAFIGIGAAIGAIGGLDQAGPLEHQP